MPTFIVDGYNMTRTIERLRQSKPHEEREALIDFVKRCHPQGSLQNKVVLVFDGRSGRVLHGPQSACRVIFTHDESADDWIKRYVDEDPHSREIVVVTADKTLSRWVRGGKARVISPQEFLGRAKSRQAPPASRDKENDDALTEELKSIWLKK